MYEGRKGRISGRGHRRSLGFLFHIQYCLMENPVIHTQSYCNARAKCLLYIPHGTPAFGYYRTKIRWHVKEPSASGGCNLDLPTDFCYAHIWSIGFVCIAPKQSTNTLGLVTCLSFIQFRLIDPSCNRTMIEYFYP